MEQQQTTGLMSAGLTGKQQTMLAIQGGYIHPEMKRLEREQFKEKEKEFKIRNMQRFAKGELKLYCYACYHLDKRAKRQKDDIKQYLSMQFNGVIQEYPTHEKQDGRKVRIIVDRCVDFRCEDNDYHKLSMMTGIDLPMHENYIKNKQQQIQMEYKE